MREHPKSILWNCCRQRAEIRHVAIDRNQYKICIEPRYIFQRECLPLGGHGEILKARRHSQLPQICIAPPCQWARARTNDQHRCWPWERSRSHGQLQILAQPFTRCFRLGKKRPDPKEKLLHIINIDQWMDSERPTMFLGKTA